MLSYYLLQTLLMIYSFSSLHYYLLWMSKFKQDNNNKLVCMERTIILQKRIRSHTSVAGATFTLMLKSVMNQRKKYEAEIPRIHLSFEESPSSIYKFSCPNPIRIRFQNLSTRLFRVFGLCRMSGITFLGRFIELDLNLRA